MKINMGSEQIDHAKANDITKWMNNNIQVDIAILDFAKAFDKVAHQRNSNTMALMEPPEYGLMHSSVKESKE